MENVKDKGNKTFYLNLVEIAKKIEGSKIKGRGLKCILADNLYRGQSNGHDGHCFIITQPVSGRILSREEFEKLSKKARSYCDKKIIAAGLPSGIGPVVAVESIDSWFRSLDRQKKHPILCGDPLYGATDVFLSEVIYGKKLHKKIVSAFEYRYGKNFIQKCRLVWKKQEGRRQKILDDSNRGID